MSFLAPSLRVVVPDPTHYVHAHAFDEITLALLGGLKRLGFDVEVTRHCKQGRARVFVLAPHLQDLDVLGRLDPDSILYTWEPRGWSHVAFMTPELTKLMREFVIWDYSRHNLATWRSEDASRVAHVPLGYDPVLERMVTQEQPVFDVLFYGSLTERRQAVLDELVARGLAVKRLFGVFGPERDAWISRSRLVLNMHAHEGQILELPRLAYLWANRIPVITELNTATEDSLDMAEAMLTAPYEDLADAVVGALHDEPAVSTAVSRCYEKFSEGPWMHDILRAAFAGMDHDVQHCPV